MSGTAAYPNVLAFDRQNGYVYLTNDGSNAIFHVHIERAPPSIVFYEFAPFGHYTNHLAFDPSNGFVYVPDPDNTSVTVIILNRLDVSIRQVIP